MALPEGSETRTYTDADGNQITDTTDVRGDSTRFTSIVTRETPFKVDQSTVNQRTFTDDPYIVVGTSRSDLTTGDASLAGLDANVSSTAMRVIEVINGELHENALEVSTANGLQYNGEDVMVDLQPIKDDIRDHYNTFLETANQNRLVRVEFDNDDRARVFTVSGNQLSWNYIDGSLRPDHLEWIDDEFQLYSLALNGYTAPNGSYKFIRKGQTVPSRIIAKLV